MQLEIDHRTVFASNAGKEHVPGQKSVIFLHGAGGDHSVWALQSRWFAHHGANVVAVDLPGHGHSDGPALNDIGALAEWAARLIETLGGSAALVGHSMGSLIALETAARHPALVDRLALIGTAARMPVHPDLLAAAEANSFDAVAMVSLWGLGGPATLGGNTAPGQWMLGGTQRLIERSAPGVLHADLFACNAYQGGAAAAAKVVCPTSLILGERDVMTQAKAGVALAALVDGAQTVTLPGAGHMLMTERPDATLDALLRWFA